MSLLPPAPSPQGMPRIVQGADAPLPPGMAMAVPVMNHGVPQINEKESLVAAKARLEADQRPRYVVVRMGMDHGPFRAVELLQQIASHTFEEEDLVKDSVDKTEMLIKESRDFAPFARHARMGRHEKAE